MQNREGHAEENESDFDRITLNTPCASAEQAESIAMAIAQDGRKKLPWPFNLIFKSHLYERGKETERQWGYWTVTLKFGREGSSPETYGEERFLVWKNRVRVDRQIINMPDYPRRIRSLLLQAASGITFAGTVVGVLLALNVIPPLINPGPGPLEAPEFPPSFDVESPTPDKSVLMDDAKAPTRSGISPEVTSEPTDTKASTVSETLETATEETRLTEDDLTSGLPGSVAALMEPGLKSALDDPLGDFRIEFGSLAVDRRLSLLAERRSLNDLGSVPDDFAPQLFIQLRVFDEHGKHIDGFCFNNPDISPVTLYAKISEYQRELAEGKEENFVWLHRPESDTLWTPMKDTEPDFSASRVGVQLKCLSDYLIAIRLNLSESTELIQTSMPDDTTMDPCQQIELQESDIVKYALVPPHVFIGTAIVGGIAASEGDQVKAQIDDFLAGSASVVGGSYRIIVRQLEGQSFEGKNIFFYIEGMGTEQSGIWSIGGADTLNLTVRQECQHQP